MPIYQKCPEEVSNLAEEILNKFDTHRPLISEGVTIDYLFAFPSEDENGVPQGDALTKNGVKCLGLCRIVNLKDRVKGLADAEISLDGLWWEDASDEERAALLDHELHHISLKQKHGAVQFDDHQRPMLRLRKHDIEIGWFDVIASRHGLHSQERIQAKIMFDARGQLYWPQVAGEGDGSTPNTILRIDGKELRLPSQMLKTGGAR